MHKGKLIQNSVHFEMEGKKKTGWEENWVSRLRGHIQSTEGPLAFIGACLLIGYLTTS